MDDLTKIIKLQEQVSELTVLVEKLTDIVGTLLKRIEKLETLEETTRSQTCD